MEVENSIDDQFSKLHPTLSLNTRIAIVGAGPSGLSAAYALIRLGYVHVTLLEKNPDVGGMCESLNFQGRVYDLGGQVLAANSGRCVFHLAKEVGAKTEEMDSHKFAVIDSSTGKFEDLKLVHDYVSIISLTLKLQDETKSSGRVGIHALSDLASDQTPQFLHAHGFSSVPKSVSYGYTASGYGYVHDMPYAYVHEFTRTSMAGKVRRFVGGYASLWNKLSQSLPINVHCSTEVLRVKRGGTTNITIDCRDCQTGEIQSMEFDQLIISGAFPFNNQQTYRSPASTPTENGSQLMDMTELEIELFSKVQTIDYYTTVLKINGLEHIPMGFYYFGEFMDDPATIGNPVAMQRFYADTDVFLFWSYGNSADISGSKVAELAKNAAKRMGGEVEEVILQRRFKYFPHVSSQDMKEGFYDKLEQQLQGQNNTYYVGGLMAFELTERNSSYSMALVCKHFANNNPFPSFPYIKRLFPMIRNNHDWLSKQLDELPGIEFPNLSSVDGYLKHWGTFDLTKRNTLYSWINDKGEIVCKRTYMELHANASYIASKILMSQKPVIKSGDRVLLIYMPGLDFIDAFFGCLRARVIPVPAIPPDPMQRGGQALLHIENIAKECNAVAILSTFSYHTSVRAASFKNTILMAGRGKCSPHWLTLPWLHTDSWIKNSKSDSNRCVVVMNELLEPLPNDLCFLQFTSGSTGDAKGVVITHGGLIHNVKLMRKSYRSTSRTVLVSWLPQYHDMGLIGGLFTALVSGGSSILFSPMTFIKNPLLWLHAMSKYRATHSAGPNFAFELIVRRLESAAKDKQLSFDLSSMAFLMVAAEPIRVKTLKRFIELTQPLGLCQEVIAPGYGLAENCVYVSSAFGEGKPIYQDWQRRICCGYVNSNDPDVDIRIVDSETGNEHKEAGKEGEIWICSPSAGIGYWGREDISKKIFRNELQEQHGRKYTRTGDLGWVIDGKLFVTGRIKDLVIVGGRNIYPSDVEKTVENSSEFLRPGCCAVIGVPEEILLAKGLSHPENSDTVGLVVIAEVREEKPVPREVIERIHAHVAEEHGVTIASIVLVKPRTISKTTSGKIKRFECLNNFTKGTLSVIQQPSLQELPVHITRQGSKTPTTGNIHKKEIIDFLKGLLFEQTSIPVSNISITESLVSYGIDSIGVVRAAQKLSVFLGVPVGAIDIFTATCIEDLACFAEALLKKSRPHFESQLSSIPEVKGSITSEATFSRKLVIWFLQLLALTYISLILMFPAYLSISTFTSMISYSSIFTSRITWLDYFIPVAFAPLAWIMCIIYTSISISLFGSSFLQPNYTQDPEVTIWSVKFVKWWALYKVQDISSKVLAVHLRGTVFLKYWFEMLGANIGSSVLLDTVDITDPSLVSIGDGAVIAEGALIQGHQVKNGVLSFHPIRIGQNSSVGPYAVIRQGSIVGDRAEVLPLQTMSSPVVPNIVENGGMIKTEVDMIDESHVIAYHFIGIYIIPFLSTLSAAITYFLYLWLFKEPFSLEYFGPVCLIGAFHWLPFGIVSYGTLVKNPPSSAINFAVGLSVSYFVHGLLLSFLTSFLSFILAKSQRKKRNSVANWLRNRIIIACHQKFGKFLSGTEAFCFYLRLFGAKIGQHCSIRAINPVSNPELISIGDGVHLGDFSRIIPGFYSSNGFVYGKIDVQTNSVVGSQGTIMPGSVIQNDVILGALSIAPINSRLLEGGVFVGSKTPVMVKNIMHTLDERIEEMDMKYKKVLGNLAANLASTTLKVKSRYFHRIGAAGKGVLKIFPNIPGLPDHKIFSPGKNYPVVIRHSNCLSSDDDARLDPRGAAIRILSTDEMGHQNPILDLTLKTGKAFHARTIGDFATWLVCGASAREEHVKHAPHVREAMWDSLRRADSYADLHYYSNICRLFRFETEREMYVKFKIRPFDETIGEDSGKVEPRGVLPPETGAIPRDKNDTRPLLFLDEDFRRRVESPEKVRFILQLQIRDVPEEEKDREIALDCTKPWDESEFPYIEVGEITLDQTLTKEESDQLEFNPFLRCHELDIIRANSCNQSASMDHGRSLVYAICQHLRNRKPIPESWKIFLDQSDVKLDLSGCPMMAAAAATFVKNKITLARTGWETLWSISIQPLMQTIVPYLVMGLVMFYPLKWVIYMKKEEENVPLQLVILAMFWVSSGVLASIGCVLAKWVLVGRNRDGQTLMIWSKRIQMDTVWQATRTLVGEYFMEMTSGSFLFGIWMKTMGSKIGWEEGAFVDSMGALLNPEMVEVGAKGSVEREALLFGHIYEGESGKVKYGRIRVEKGGFVGTRAVCMPGVTIQSGASLSPLSLAMKGEIVT
ncbi:uncharacterized protein LOC124923793 [Impatiens glandulifera]|uniref:uncharacterized protein LOC124923793 n=1 Tax=Impatiens glandulifera TaxID=253017 RepID=UPI001FB0D110|nr:uncharacterized protein LOC124923793 [Impatiens glandulifera]